MADYLTTALGGLGTTTNETPWGTVGQILLEQSPLLINKQRPSGGNLAAAFGTALLGGLIKYRGRQDAAEQTAEAASLAQQIQSAKTPEERLALAQSAESGGVRTKLTSLVNALGMQDVANARDIAQKKAEMIAGYEAEMSPLGQALAARKRADRMAEIKALADSRNKTKADGKIGGVERTALEARVERLAKQFEELGDMSAIEWNKQSNIPGTKANLALSNLEGSMGTLAKVAGLYPIGKQDIEDIRRSVVGPNVFGMGISGTNTIAKRIRQYLSDSSQVAAVNEGDTTDSELPPINSNEIALEAAGFTRTPSGGWLPPGAANGK